MSGVCLQIQLSLMSMPDKFDMNFLYSPTSNKKSKILENSSNLALEQAKLNLESSIQRAFTDAKAALKSYEASQKSLQAQQLAFDNSKDRYDLGALNSFDLEQARIRLLNAKSSLINSKYDFIFKTKVLDYYTGKLIQ